MTSLSSHEGWASSALVPLALLAGLVAASPWACRLLPPRHRVEAHWGEAGVYWFGHGLAACWCLAAAALVCLFAVRYWVVTLARSPAAALAWYALLLACVLPAVWLLVACDWDNEAVSPAANWVGVPVALLAVPTAVLCLDAATGYRPPPGEYAARCLLEVVFIPAWGTACVWFGWLVLGWVGF